MRNIFDVQQLLKRFGTIIYTGSRLADIEMMQDEVRQLYLTQLIDIQVYQAAVLILRTEQSKYH